VINQNKNAQTPLTTHHIDERTIHQPAIRRTNMTTLAADRADRAVRQLAVIAAAAEADAEAAYLTWRRVAYGSATHAEYVAATATLDAVQAAAAAAWYAYDVACSWEA